MVWKEVPGRERVDDVELWKPEKKEDFRVGIFKGAIKTRTGYMYQFEARSSWKIWQSVVLKERLEKIRIGDEVKVVYKGFRHSRTGRAYKMFDVFLRSNA